MGECLPYRALQGTQCNIQSGKSLHTTNVTCAVPNTQCCPHKYGGRYLCAICSHSHLPSPQSMVVHNAQNSTSSPPSSCVAAELLASVAFQIWEGVGAFPCPKGGDGPASETKVCKMPQKRHPVLPWSVAKLAVTGQPTVEGRPLAVTTKSWLWYMECWCPAFLSFFYWTVRRMVH